MERPFRVREAVEGAARILVPDVPRRRGPGTRGPWPFYNPTMAVSRDLSAVLLRGWPRPVRKALDGLAATGIWGIRMGLEARVPDLVFNDRLTASAALIRENVRRNGLGATVVSMDLRALLPEVLFDLVDVDPFGPPTPFLEAAFRVASEGSGVWLTATDTAPLCGTYPLACARRYGARPLRCDEGSEIGLRILLGYCARIAAAREKGIRPILAYSAEHFLRVHVLVASAEEAGPLRHVVREGPGRFRPADPKAPDALGPMWLGPLLDPRLVRALQPSEWTGVPAARLLAVLQDEADLPPFFVTTDEMAAHLRGSPPKLDAFLEGLRDLGFRAARTHFHPRGVKTDAPPDDVVRVFRECAPTGPTGGSGPAR
jgi:tRNA (guanine26-N2/guanine27-N2)-dimethyltransferase